MSVDGYTVKERVEQLASMIAQQLGGIISQLDVIDRKLDEKASKTHVELIEKRVNTLELRMAGTAAVSTFQRWLVGVVGVGCLGSIATLVWLATGGH